MRAVLGVLIVVLAILTSSCAFYIPQNVAEWQAMTKQLDGSGCFYARGNSRPYADVSVLVVSTYGKNAPKYLECLQAIPPEARSILHP